MFVVDTNILVYAADEVSPFHERCLELLEAWRRQVSAWYTTWSTPIPPSSCANTASDRSTPETRNFIDSRSSSRWTRRSDPQSITPFPTIILKVFTVAAKRTTKSATDTLSLARPAQRIRRKGEDTCRRGGQQI